MSYHVRNSSHVTDHFLHMLRYMCCVACCWKSCLTPAVRVLEGAGRAAASCRRSGLSKYCNWQLRSYMRRSTCGSYRIAIFCVISYRIYRFSSWLYCAITTINLTLHIPNFQNIVTLCSLTKCPSNVNPVFSWYLWRQKPCFPLMKM